MRSPPGSRSRGCGEEKGTRGAATALLKFRHGDKRLAEQLFQRLAVPSSNLGYSLKREMFPRGILHPYLRAGGCSGERALFPARSVPPVA